MVLDLRFNDYESNEKEAHSDISRMRAGLRYLQNEGWTERLQKKHVRQYGLIGMMISPSRIKGEIPLK